jgi:hypothetical protein
MISRGKVLTGSALGTTTVCPVRGCPVTATAP